MISKIDSTSQQITSTAAKPEKKEYNDPLNRWYMKGISYSNELGTAIHEVAPVLGKVLWAPTLMYIGADIYDKYKNDKDQYDPSGKRAFEQAIYQGIMNLVASPLIIYAGQKAVSPLGKFTEEKISINTKDTVYRHTMNILDQGAGEILENKDDFKKLIARTLENRINDKKQAHKNANIFKKFANFFKKDYSLIKTDKEKLLEFADKNVEKLFEVKDSIQNPGTKKITCKKAYLEYHKILPEMNKMHGTDLFNRALKGAYAKYQENLIFKNKLLKTTGGLIALGTLVGPVNRLVQEKFIDKYVDPGLQGLSSDFVNNFYMNNLFMYKNGISERFGKGTKEPPAEETPTA